MTNPMKKMEDMVGETIRRVCVYYCMNPKEIPNEYVKQLCNDLISLFNEIVDEASPKEHGIETYKDLSWCEPCGDSEKTCLWNEAIQQFKSNLKKVWGEK